MRDPREHMRLQNAPKVKVAVREQVLPVNVISVSLLVVVLLLIVSGMSGT